MCAAIKCIKCGAVSYNDFGKTHLYCHGCFTKRQEVIKDAIRKLAELNCADDENRILAYNLMGKLEDEIK